MFMRHGRSNPSRITAIVAALCCASVSAQTTLPAGDIAASPTGATAPSRPPELTRDKEETRHPPAGLLTPIPEAGNVPPIVAMMDGPSDDELRYRAAARKYAQQIRLIRHKFLGPIKA